MSLGPYPSRKHCYQHPGISRYNQILQILKAGSLVMKSVILTWAQLILSERALTLRPATSTPTVHLSLRKRWSIFLSEEECHKMSHPILPCSWLELAIPKCSPEIGLTSLPRGLDWICLSCWGFAPQRRLLEVSTSASFFHGALWNSSIRKMSWTVRHWTSLK